MSVKRLCDTGDQSVGQNRLTSCYKLVQRSLLRTWEESARMLELRAQAGEPATEGHIGT